MGGGRGPRSPHRLAMEEAVVTAMPTRVTAAVARVMVVAATEEAARAAEMEAVGSVVGSVVVGWEGEAWVAALVVVAPAVWRANSR